MSYHSGSVFSARDRDPNNLLISCAVSYRGAWWYRNCHYANLNGLYGSTVDHQVRHCLADRRAGELLSPSPLPVPPARPSPHLSPPHPLICGWNSALGRMWFIEWEGPAQDGASILCCGDWEGSGEGRRLIGFWEPGGGGRGEQQMGVCSDSTSFPGSELVPLEGLRVLRALHGDEAETQRLPGACQGRLSSSPLRSQACPPSTEGPRGEPGPATTCPRGGFLHRDLTALCLQGGEGERIQKQ